MEAFPAFFPLAGRIVVIAGSGRSVEAKARLFDGSPARVVRLEGEAARDPKRYRGAVLAFVAADDPEFCNAAAAAARAAHVPVNVTDRPALCDFTTPAVIDRGEVVAAIGTGGAAPMLATLLRHDIEARIPEGIGRVAGMLRSLRREIRAALPELHLRRAFLRAALAGPAAEAAMSGDLAGAQARLREDLAKGIAPKGQVVFVAGEGPAEMLTLAASRALAAADLLVLDPGVDPEVLALARRDAERMEPASLEPDQIAEMTLRGLRVVRVIVGHPAPEELRTLAEQGAEVRVAPVA